MLTWKARCQWWTSHPHSKRRSRPTLRPSTCKASLTVTLRSQLNLTSHRAHQVSMSSRWSSLSSHALPKYRALCWGLKWRKVRMLHRKLFTLHRFVLRKRRRKRRKKLSRGRLNWQWVQRPQTCRSAATTARSWVSRTRPASSTARPSAHSVSLPRQNPTTRLPSRTPSRRHLSRQRSSKGLPQI